MKYYSRKLVAFLAATATLAAGLAAPAPTGPAADTAAAGTSASLAASNAAVEKNATALLKALALGDARREATARATLEAYLQAVVDWHHEADPRLKPLWQEWSAARATGHQDEGRAAAITDRIDAIYASFRPQYDAFVSQLGTVLSPADVARVQEAMTRVPGLERTYRAYLEIVPDLSEAQKKQIHATLVVARDQAMATLDKQERINLFKKEKLKVQSYLSAQGYDWNRSYAAFVAKIQAAAAAKKATPVETEPEKLSRKPGIQESEKGSN